MTTILIAEDEPRIAAFLAKGLRAQGYAVLTAGDGATALDLAGSGDVDLVVLDLGLPVMDGTEVLAALRGQGHTVPVIILTARDSVSDVVAGLDSGADDYMAKPFQVAELLARIRLRLRESAAPAAGEAGPAGGTPSGHVLTLGDLSLDLLTRTATVGEREVELSAREFALLETFLRNPGQVLSREQLLNAVWGYDYDPGSNVVDVYVGYLRKKIGAGRVATQRGMGYRLERRPPGSTRPDP